MLMEVGRIILLYILAIDGGSPFMRCMLCFFRCNVEDFFQSFHDIPGHLDINIAIVVIPVSGEATIVCACEVS